MKTDISMFDSYQQDIILENSGKDIVVGASAGAGKTMVLVARILKRCMEDRISVDRILALTFTAAAAQEMKNRLSKQFHDLRAKTDDPEETKYIDAQISLLANADITTIDAYCLTIIQRFCTVIGLNPATAENILSEGRNEQIQHEAFRRALNAMASDADGFAEILRLCEYFSPRPQDYERLYGIVKKVNLHASAAVDPSAWYDRCRSTYQKFNSIRQLPDFIRNEWFSLLRENCMAALNSALNIKALIDEEPDKKLKPEMIIPVINLLNHALLCIEQQDYDGYLSLLKEAAVQKTPKPADARAAASREMMNDKISKLLEISFEQASFAANSENQTKIIGTLVTLCENTAAMFRQMKEELICMNFSDMERYALEILTAQNGRIARRLNHAFDEIMIDEFQDTSFLQDTILTTIAKAERNVPVFRVGDVKQSIYRFRQAKPELMRNMMSDDANAVFHMHYNYRSDKGVVDFTNLLFERIMNVPGSRDTYGEEDHVDTGTAGQNVITDEPAVKLYLLQSEETGDDGKKVKRSAAEVKNEKASFISQKICQMIEESHGQLHFSDFAVLSRSHGDQIVLRGVFDRFHIPYDIDAHEGFFQSDLCRDILAIAKVMRDPYDEIALCAVLSGPLFSYSDEQLAAAKKNAKSLSEGVYETDPDVAKLFDEFRGIMHEYGLEALLSAIANTPLNVPDHNGPIAFYDALPLKDQANFDYLFDLCVSADLGSLNDLIREMEIGEAENSSEAVTTGKGDDVVTVTTIHHSKGLQYRIVFLWGTGGNKFSDGMEPVMIDDEFMLGIRDIDMKYRIALPTIQRLVIQNRTDKEDIDEFTRLLYVAVTRARAQLIIVDSEDAEEAYTTIIDASLPAKRKGITGLITAALNHENIINENGLFKVERVMHAEDAQRYHYLSEQTRKQNAEQLPRLGFEPQILPEIKTPSSLEKSRSASLNTAGTPRLPSFTGKNTGGSNYGTLMHKACEDMPDDREWTEELIRSVADPSLPDKAIHDLYVFGHSDLYKRAQSMEIHKEYPFYYESSTARINGTIDFAAVSPEKIIVIDFKTDRLKPEEIAEEYGPQLNTYKDVMHSFYPEAEIELYAWSFHNGAAVIIRPDPEQ